MLLSTGPQILYFSRSRGSEGAFFEARLDLVEEERETDMETGASIAAVAVMRPTDAPPLAILNRS